MAFPTQAPFFIFGCPRSGTSLLSRLLGSHPSLAVPRESHLYNGIYPIVRRFRNTGSPAIRSRLVAEILRTEHIRRWNPAPSLAHTLAAIRHPDFHGIVQGLMSAWAQDQGKQRWGEKTPQHTLCWRPILEGFPELQLIHLVRDGRDVALSYKRAAFGPSHVYPLALRWKQYLLAAEAARAQLGEKAFLQIRYEDLLSDPERELRRICAFLGEEFTSSMLTFYEDPRCFHAESQNARNLRRPVMSHNTGKWRTGMSAREIRIFESLAGELLERYGYERILDKPRISTWEMLSCRYVEHPPRRLASLVWNRAGYRIAVQRLRLHLLRGVSQWQTIVRRLGSPRGHAHYLDGAVPGVAHLESVLGEKRADAVGFSKAAL
jgi:hypothetical protein